MDGNLALHRIALVRMRLHEPRATAYLTRRRAEELVERDIVLCLKCHVADEVFGPLTHPPAGFPQGR